MRLRWKVKMVMQKEQRALKQLVMMMKMILTKLSKEIAQLKLQLKNWQMTNKRHRRSFSENYAKVFVTSLNTTKICNTST